MALFKKKGDNLSRAGAILDALSPKEIDAQAPEAQQQNDTPLAAAPVVDTLPVVNNDTPPEGAPNSDALAEVVNHADVVATTDVDEPTVTPERTVPQNAEVTEEILLAKLSERLGRKVDSFDDLTPKEANIDPELKQLQEWKEKTGLPLSEWSNYTRDFSKMGDMDVAREILAKKYPNFTKEELNYELKGFVYDEATDDEGMKMKKSIELKKFAAEGRGQLEAQRLELKSSAPQAVLTKEQQDAIALAQQVQQQSLTTKQQQEAYNAGIVQASTNLEAIDLKLSDNLTIKYNIPVEVKKGLPKMVAEMPHWYNEDGTYNHLNVVKDVAKVTNFEAMVKAAYEQGIAAGTESRIKAGGNITVDGVPNQAPASTTKGNVTDVVSKITGAKTGSKLRFRTKK
jgi:tellurite resistance-related uncharacterized protein